jgi:hypothetical protein
MTATLLLAGALLAQAAAAPPLQASDPAEVDVAYSAMTHGDNDAAIDKLRASAGSDPAALINLGTAYARKGMKREAAASFAAAMASSDRYELQLADGSWMDSRRAARIALDRLQNNGTFTMR